MWMNGATYAILVQQEKAPVGSKDRHYSFTT